MKKEIKKHTLTKPVAVRARLDVGLSRELVRKFTEEEAQMQAADREAIETSEAKYALESYEYTMRDRIAGQLAAYATQSEGVALQKELDNERRWLEEEGENQKKAVYLERLRKLQAIGDPIIKRKAEADARPRMIAELESAIRSFQEFVASTDAKYAHIDAAERQKVADYAAAAAQWLQEQRAKQEALPAHADPVLTTSGIAARATELRAQCNPIVSKPKPAPPKAETPKKTETSTPPPKTGATPPPAGTTTPPAAEQPAQAQQEPPKSPPKATDMDI
eukprot:m51a1_g12510 putative heat shock 70 kda protein 15-like (278) ;mRNA; r:3507-4340